MNNNLRTASFCALLLTVALCAQTPATGPAPAATAHHDSKADATKTPAVPIRDSFGRIQLGDAMPDFTVQTPDGKEAKFSDYAKGKTVILDFWATWCGPCQQAMPHYEEIHRMHGAKGVVILGVCSFDTRANYDKWLADTKGKYTFATVIDPVGAPGAGDKDAFGRTVMGQLTGGPMAPLPTTLVVNPAGKFVGCYMGYAPAAHDALATLLIRAGVGLADADKPTAIVPVGSTAQPPASNPSTRVADSDKRLKEAAEDEAERQAAIEEEKKNPKPKFRTSLGGLKETEAVPDFTAQAPDGSAVKFSELTRSKTTVFMTWTASSGIPDAALAFTDGWARRYADQGVLFVALGAYGSRADFDKWHAANVGKFSFPVLFDPAGEPPRMPKESPSDMTAAETKAFMDAARAHYPKVIPVAFCGGGMVPTPHSTVIDAQGRFVGFYVGAGPQTAESLGNLLLRAGIKLKPEDMPSKVFTAEETKEKLPEERVEMLKIGALAPDFPATDAAGKKVMVSDYRGKVVVLDFWATWCGPCLASMPHTQEIAAHYKDQGVVVLASCTNDVRKKFDSWVKRNQTQYPDIIFSHDPQERGPDRASRKLYGVDGIPQQFIIDREGKVVALVSGYLKGETLLEAALAEAGIKVDPTLLAKAAEDMKRREAAR